MLDEKTLYDKIYACWLGKNIGGTLGGPVEGQMRVMDIKWYPKLSEDGALPNDDLDLQLVNLHALQVKGAAITADDIAETWREHVFFPFDEYGCASTNMRCGFKPPFSGSFDNCFADCMGSPIRSEIWAAVAAGDPGLAASLAVRDAIVDHAGGEGVYGEIFNAAMQAAAYENSDKESLIESALECIPEECIVYKAVALALCLYREGKPLSFVREEVLRNYGSPNFTYAPQNIAFGVCGILYGEDFEDAILKTVNLGYDTDCTVATAAATLGIMYGTEYIPEKWSRPVGDRIVVSAMVRGLDAPKDLDELTRECIRLYNMLKYSDREAIKAAAPSRTDASYQKYIITADENRGFSAALYYETEPVCAPDRDCRVRFELRNESGWSWRVKAALICPDGFCSDGEKELIIAPKGTGTVRFTVKAGAMPDKRVNRICLSLTRINDDSVWTEYRLPFTVLRPNVWSINGEKKYFAGSTLTLEGEAETFVCEATLYEPQTRKTVLICNCENPTKLELDGNVLIDSDGALYLPAYHRSPWEQRAELTLSEGEHKVRITVKNNGKDRRLYFSYNATREVSEPGNNYSHIDAVLK